MQRAVDTAIGQCAGDGRPQACRIRRHRSTRSDPVGEQLDLHRTIGFRRHQATVGGGGNIRVIVRIGAVVHRTTRTCGSAEAVASL